MSKSLKSILIEGNRYIDVVNMLYKILNSTCSNYPLHHPYIDGSNVTHWRADGKKVREQAKLLLELLDNDSCGGTDDSFIELGAYIDSNCEIYLINYAVAMSHDISPEHDIEIVRQWEVLRSLVDCWKMTDEEWTIPDAWKGKI